MPTGSEIVCFQGQIGSDRRMVRMMRLTRCDAQKNKKGWRTRKIGSPFGSMLLVSTGRKASTPCHFHRSDQYHDEAIAFAAPAALFARQRVDGLRLARHLRKREALSA
jgi:hypothetical protein